MPYFAFVDKNAVLVRKNYELWLTLHKGAFFYFPE